MARILLADDDRATRDFVKRALEGEGHQVAATQDGGEALERVLAPGADFDVLVTDVEMPALDGIALAEQATAAKPKLRILLMSGFADELQRSKTVRAGKLGVLLKPFTLEQLRAAVRNLIN